MTSSVVRRPGKATRLLRCGAIAGMFALSGLDGVPTAQAEDGAFTATYNISLAGVTIGGATMVANINGAAYSVDLHAKLTGLAGVLTSGKGGAKSAGALSGAGLSPASLAVVSSTSDVTRTLRLAFASGRVDAVEIKPPLEDWDRPDRVPVAEGDKRGVIDPLSALLMPVAAGADPKSACQRTIPIFDGATRFNVVLSYVRTAQVAKDGYRGPAIVCAARYVPISGHRAARSVTRYMEQNRDMGAWLIPVANTNVYAPYRISVKTMIGTTVLEATKLNVAGTLTAAGPTLVKSKPRD
ncbi:DUF3108 domain-containing protein [Chelatococcus reniformis]|uniref:DUF3108 domain-containing protein n=1 Tax=Chelatococcus reniformis TaxID=1494448 RepID=A0A916UND0_9HYPH|nr:DUF3108 domain-containing protein [Chelatococcus reniformis]GGC79682.1 hypothetical protein GCM10010994_42170 [Chelatococcus reniformis]